MLCCVVLCCVVLCCVVLCCVVLCCVQGLYCRSSFSQEVSCEHANFFYAKIQFLHSNTPVTQKSRGTKSKISIANIIMQFFYLSRVHKKGFLGFFLGKRIFLHVQTYNVYVKTKKLGGKMNSRPQTRGTYPLEDGTEKIFLNTTATDLNNLDLDLRLFYDYF